MMGSSRLPQASGTSRVENVLGAQILKNIEAAPCIDFALLIESQLGGVGNDSPPDMLDLMRATPLDCQ